MKIKEKKRMQWKYYVFFMENILLVTMVIFFAFKSDFIKLVSRVENSVQSVNKYKNRVMLQNIFIYNLDIIMENMGWGNMYLDHLGGYSYLDNSQYLPGVSMFDITERKSAKIIFAGDSLTARGNFEEFFDERDIINRGIGSDISEGLYNRIDQVISLNPEKVFIMIGINDISKNIPLEDTLHYVREICKAIEESNSDIEVFIQSVLPTVSGDVEQEKKIKELNQRYSTLCDKNEKLFFVDLYTLFLNNKSEANSEFYSIDGVHLNGDGYKVWIDSISEFVDR